MIQAGIPAWKRLGLKLKYANESSDQPNSNGKHPADYQGVLVSPEQPQTTSVEPPKKKQKTESKSKGIRGAPMNGSTSSSTTNGNEVTPRTSLKKQVSFAADTKTSAVTANGTSEQEVSMAEEVQAVAKGKKPKKKSARKSQQTLVQKSNTALEYLKQYHITRSSWKFNKNRETWILKHVLSETDIPRDYDLALARYIQGLQGTGARERLKEQCVESLKKEEDAHDEVNGHEDDSSPGQERAHLQRFQDALAEVSDAKDEHRDQKYLSWIRRQRRPKLLLRAFGVDDAVLESGFMDTKTETRVERLNGAGGDAKVKAKKRKNRTAIVEYDSSSSSGSDSDSDSEDDDHKSGRDRNMSSSHQSEDTSSSGSDSESSSSGESEEES